MENKPLNPSMTTLPDLLEERNKEGKYNEIIENARKGFYHDFKFDLVNPECINPCPKISLVLDLSKFPELKDIVAMTVNGDFDDRADEDDKKRLREEFKDMPDPLRKAFGLDD
jgi:hypothetical protein